MLQTVKDQIAQLQENLDAVRKTATKKDVVLTHLQASIVESLELRLQVLQYELEALGGPAGVGGISWFRDRFRFPIILLYCVL